MAKPPLRLPPRKSPPRIEERKGPLASASLDELVSALGSEGPEGAPEADVGQDVRVGDPGAGLEQEAALVSDVGDVGEVDEPDEPTSALDEGAGSQAIASALTATSEADDVEDDAADRRAAAAAAGVTLLSEIPVDPEDDLRDVEGEASLRLVSIVESLLFAASKPLSVADLRRLLQETSKQQIQLALKHLMVPAPGRGVVVAQVAGGFTMRTHHENAVWVQRLLQAKPSRLSRSQLETLAIAAYRQPVTRPEIDAIRGVDSGAVLKALLERELLQIVGKKDEPGRPLLYGTTLRFLEFFNLRSLRDLPTLRDFRDLSEESKATLRSRFGAEEALGQEVMAFAEEEEGEAAASASALVEEVAASARAVVAAEPEVVMVAESAPAAEGEGADAAVAPDAEVAEGEGADAAVAEDPEVAPVNSVDETDVSEESGMDGTGPGEEGQGEEGQGEEGQGEEGQGEEGQGERG